MKYKISTGGWSKKVEAETVKDAIIKALKTSPPKNLGGIIEAKELEGEAKETYYSDSIRALKWAGFEIKD